MKRCRSWPRWARTPIPGSKVRCPAIGRGASEVAGPELRGSEDCVVGCPLDGGVERGASPPRGAQLVPYWSRRHEQNPPWSAVWARSPGGPACTIRATWRAVGHQGRPKESFVSLSWVCYTVLQRERVPATRP